MNIKNISQILIISIFSIFLSACIKPAQNQTQNQNQQQENISGTFKDLLGLGRSVKCTWEDPQGQGKGTVYVSGNKAKSEIEIKAEGEKMTMNTLIDGDWMYQWGNSFMGNTKMNLKELEKLGEQYKQQEQPQQAQDYNQQLNYSCTPWGVDQSTLNLPAGVEFTDTTDQIIQMAGQAEQIQEQAEQMQQDLCKMCNSLPGEAKTECLNSCQ